MVRSAVASADYNRIKRARTDFSDRLVHMTSLSRLRKIVRDGYLKAGFARRTSGGGRYRPTVKGPTPVVCFSEMPLAEVYRLAKAGLKKKRYRPYGVAMDKAVLYRRGARPVIYGDEDLIGYELDESTHGFQGCVVYEGDLPQEHQWRYVRLDLATAGYEVDWTHEREWRCRPLTNYEDQFAGVPLHPLEEGFVDPSPCFSLFVDTAQDKEALQKLVAKEVSSGESMDEHQYDAIYRQALKKVEIEVLAVLCPDS